MMTVTPLASSLPTEQPLRAVAAELLFLEVQVGKHLRCREHALGILAGLHTPQPGHHAHDLLDQPGALLGRIGLAAVERLAQPAHGYHRELLAAQQRGEDSVRLFREQIDVGDEDIASRLQLGSRLAGALRPDQGPRPELGHHRAQAGHQMRGPKLSPLRIGGALRNRQWIAQLEGIAQHLHRAGNHGLELGSFGLPGRDHHAVEFSHHTPPAPAARDRIAGCIL
jgi:hypothetical protein